MRVRIFELRLIAAGLTVAWTITAALLLFGYRPGGPVDLIVGLTATTPIAISLAGLVWPPAARGDRAFGAVVWLGLSAALLLAPSIRGVVDQIAARGTQTLLPSPESAYPWLLALAATSLFSGLGIARRLLGETELRRRRLVRGVAIGGAFTLVTSLLFTGAAIGNELALRDRPALSSRFGPTDPLLEPPDCDGVLLDGPSARVELRLDGAVDGRSIGSVVVEGARRVDDIRWTALVATTSVIDRFGYARLGPRAWSLLPGSGWTPTESAAGVTGLLDRQVLRTALGADVRVAAERRGLEFVEGARARHCRIAVDGRTFRSAFPQVEFLLGADPLRHWRGELDYWVFGDGQLGQVTASLSGEPGDLDRDAVQATVRVVLVATDRGTPIEIVAPRS